MPNYSQAPSQQYPPVASHHPPYYTMGQCAPNQIQYQNNQAMYYQNTYPPQIQPQLPLQYQQFQQQPQPIQNNFNNPQMYHSQMQNNNAFLQKQLSMNVKPEPVIPDQTKLPPPVQAPHFTNPIPFKQEPTESNLNQKSSQPTNSTTEEDTNAISIVTHLLKDKQILNQLDKVARSFQKPAGSVYQGSWNFTQPSS